MHASEQLEAARGRRRQMPYGTLKKKHHDFTQKTRAALYNGGFVFLASHETGSAPIAFIFLSRSPSSPCAPPVLLSTSPSLSAKRMSTGSWERFGLRSFNQILEVSLQMSGYSWFFPAAPILAGWCADEGGGIPSHHRQARPRAHAHGFLRDSWKSAPLPQVPHPTQKD